MGIATQRETLLCANTTSIQVDRSRINKFLSQWLHYLLCHGVPVLVAFTHIHALLVEEPAFLRNQQDIAYKLTH